MSEPPVDTEALLERITTEKHSTQERRGILILRKLTWLAGLFAVGVLDEPLHGSEFVLYLLPAVALLFDLYIFGENYGIKRMGTFIRLTYPRLPDGEWEAWLQGSNDLGPKKTDNETSDGIGLRDILSRAAGPGATYLVTAASAALLQLTSSPPLVGFVAWFIGMIILITVVVRFDSNRLSKLDDLKSAKSYVQIQNGAINRESLTQTHNSD